MARDTVLVESVGNMVKLTVFGILVGNLMAILTAELIFHLRSERLRSVLRTLFIVPMVVPGVVGILIWRSFFDPVDGLLNAVLGLIGVPPQGWLGSFRWALPSLMLMGLPWIGGFPLLIYMGGLHSISVEVLDAAAVDGATGIRRFLRVDLPLILSEIRLLVILNIIGGVQAFEGILILTRGGPGNATLVPGLHMFVHGFEYSRMGYACAVGVALFIAILGFTCLSMRYIRPPTEFEGRRAA
jgi:raffinose/stachyose/melibiose transport system permease protein